LSLWRRAWLECNIHNYSQLVKVGFIHLQDAHSGQENPHHHSGILRKNTRAVSQLPTLWDADQRCARIINDMPAKAAALPRISEQMCHSFDTRLNIAYLFRLAHGLAICMRICHEDIPSNLRTPELQPLASTCCNVA